MLWYSMMTSRTTHSPCLTLLPTHERVDHGQRRAMYPEMRRVRNQTCISTTVYIFFLATTPYSCHHHSPSDGPVAWSVVLCVCVFATGCVECLQLSVCRHLVCLSFPFLFHLVSILHTGWLRSVFPVILLRPYHATHNTHAQPAAHYLHREEHPPRG